MLLRLCLTVGIAFLAGKLVARFKLPSILGWLIAGMALGPHAFSLISQQILDAQWYQIVIHILECGVGLMIGTELEAQTFGMGYHHHNAYPVFGDFPVCISGVWHCILFP